MDESNSKPPRRVRYKGTHPKGFKEKYKELAPQKYGEDVAKVIQQGRTPAGMHISICVKEIMNFLQIKPGQTGLDVTVGYGGHSLEMLKQLMPGGKLYGIDVDPIELPKTRKRLQDLGYGDDALVLQKMNFSDIDQVFYQSGPLNFVLADLGVSSMQIDNPERGFSLKLDGPLDLRLNPSTGKSAAAFLKKCSQQQLKEILIENSDEPHAEKIATAIFERMGTGQLIETTAQLKEVIENVLVNLHAATRKEEIRKSCQRCFQALRIEVNKEFDVLDKFLAKLPDVLASGGRVAILSFHSGEDRRVKKSFQTFFRDGVYAEIAEEPIRPTIEEINSNPRAKSTKFRWAVMR
jgi:16S rRNA (cytosine1402-N4)-methyltransferase